MANDTSPVSTSEIDNPLALEQQVCFALAVASRTVISVYRPLLDPLGLTHPQYLVMLAMWEFEPLSVGELARLLELDAGTLSRLLKRLETAGLLRRERNSSDERALALVLTKKGRALRTRAEKIPAAIVDQLGMTIPELTRLHDQLTQVIAAAKHAQSVRPARRPGAPTAGSS